MLILGHAGITLQAARKLHRGVDLRFAAFIALYPDIIDKALHYIYCPLFAPGWTHGFTRTVGHSLTFNALVAGKLLLWWWRDRELHPARWVYAAIIPLHLVLDEMWDPELRLTLFWPWLGNDFPRIYMDDLVSHLGRNFAKVEVIVGEIVGGFLLWDLRSHFARKSVADSALVATTGVQPNGGDDDHALDDLLVEFVDVEKAHAVVQRSDEEGTEHGATDGARATGEPGAADDHGGDGIQLEEVAGGGHRPVEPGREHGPGHP